MKIKEDSIYKKAIAARDGLKCKKCGETNLDVLTVDHVIPISLGGSIGLENLQFLCQPCHVEKDRYVSQIGHGGRKRFKQKINNLKLRR